MVFRKFAMACLLAVGVGWTPLSGCATGERIKLPEPRSEKIRVYQQISVWANRSAAKGTGVHLRKGERFSQNNLDKFDVTIIVWAQKDWAYISAFFKQVLALIRSLVRAFAIQDFTRQCDRRDYSAGCSDTAVLNTIDQTNRYIADTHADTAMFATLFMGILEHETGRLRYVNCGHEPPLVIGQGRIVQRLKPTGPALGVFPDSTFAIGEVTVDHGEAILAFTDGLIESESSTGEAFGKKRLAGLVTNPSDGVQSLLERIVQVMALHTSGQEPFDDVTIVALRREARAAQA